jgi:hypothetical protein
MSVYRERMTEVVDESLPVRDDAAGRLGLDTSDRAGPEMVAALVKNSFPRCACKCIMSASAKNQTPASPARRMAADKLSFR